jgi:phage terminase small subunit
MANPRKPTALKLIAGNPGKRPLNPAEPKFPPTDCDPPDWLHAAAMPIWDRLATCLDLNGMLNEGNRDMLAVYCDIIASYERKREQTGEPDLKLAQQMRMIAREFGFTPSSQGGIGAGKKDDDDQFFG